jgi:signal transduction histidine kinase
VSAERSQEDELAELAHELKTPVAAIKGFAELLATRDDEDSRREAAAQIAVGIERLEKSIDDILALFGEEPQLVARLAESRSRS